LKLYVKEASGNNERFNTLSEKKVSNAKRDDGESNRVIVGNSDNGGAANANWNHPANSNDNVGFRVAVVLSLTAQTNCPNQIRSYR